MDLRRTGIIAAIAAVAVVSTAAGVAGRRAAPANPVAAAVISAQPVVVVARKPSLTEILDVILHERPTAAELGAKSAKGAFPEGSDEAHVAKVLSRYNNDESLVSRIAASLVKEGRRRHIGSSLLVGVLLTENPDLNPRATSFVGARGLMQVMPFHAGKWGCGSRDLFDVESNICHGVAVLADNLGGARNLPQALLGYNGCVRGTNTPDCKKYPRIVYGRARKGEDSTSKAFAR
jgi:soluble lytic murein transglycosylase-like protein